VWYYIGQRTERVAFFKPDVTERQVVEIMFDETDRVSEMKVIGLEEGQEVELVERVTPTEGRDLTILQQFLGNLGRFNAPTP
ncbi:MAG TPA: outer membrane protein assembly factor BamE, partial [Kiloniellales bacterium]|nr:outer membrane protein assembly factor BamE [Kiloniellales bacterium]